MPENHRESTSIQESEEISVLDVLIIIAKHKRLIFGLPLVVGLLAALISLGLPNVYTATAKILPPQQGQSAAAAMLAQLGNVGGLVGGGVGVKNPSDVYVAMLKSRTVADNLIQRFDLMKLYEVSYRSQARKKLEKDSNIVAAKDGIITVDFDEKDPKRAAEVANAYVEELLKLTQVLAVTEASQRRLFFERQFAQAKENLTKAEITAREALGQGGLVKVDEQGRAMIATTARLRAQITLKEVQIGAMRAFASESNPDLRLAQREVESLKSELGKLEGNGGRLASDSSPSKQGMESLRLLRDVKYHEVIFELLARQFEMAKIDEAKDSAVVQVMDKAIEPDRKSKPARSLIVLAFALASFLAALLWSFAIEGLAKAADKGEKEGKIEDLKRYLKWR